MNIDHIVISLDGLNTHDDSYALSVAGGVTTSLVLPGSADAIGESEPIVAIYTVNLNIGNRRSGLRYQTSSYCRKIPDLNGLGTSVSDQYVFS